MTVLLTAKASEIHHAFLEHLDRKLAQAFVAGKRLAVSEFMFEAVPTRYGVPASSIRVLFMQLDPGEAPPPKHKWIIYEAPQ